MTSDYRSKTEDQKTQMDMILLVAVILLLLVGLLMVYSASNAISREYHGGSYRFLKMQALWCCLGLIIMVCATFFKFRNYQRLAWLLLGIAGGLLVLTYIPGIRIKHGGGYRWIKIGNYSFQPVEFAKLALVIYMARFLSRNSDYVQSFKRGILPSLLVLSVFFVLIYKQPDFGSVVLIGTVVFVMLFVGGAKISQIALMAFIAILVATIEVWREPYRWTRITVFLDPWKDPDGDGYHIIQSYYALGAGGVLGRGLGAGMQKLHYLPVPHSDFIFAVIGEELGFVRSLLIIFLYMVIVWRGMCIALSTKDQFGSLLAIGITSLLAIQTIINIGVVTGTLPTKGITLPFLSYGGSSILMSLAAIGILLNISKAKSVKQRV